MKFIYVQQYGYVFRLTQDALKRIASEAQRYDGHMLDGPGVRLLKRPARDEIKVLDYGAQDWINLSEHPEHY